MVSTSTGPAVTTTLPEVPDSLKLKVPDTLHKIPEPWKPRANQAPSAENPNPPLDPERAGRSVLQQHVDFWDFDRDGKIYPWDTYRGFHMIGFNPVLSVIAVFVIHGTFSYATQNGWLPDPLFSLIIKNMHHAKHGSDSGTYDHAGRFIPANFEQIFASFDHGNKGGLTLQEMWEFSQFTRMARLPQALESSQL